MAEPAASDETAAGPCADETAIVCDLPPATEASELAWSNEQPEEPRSWRSAWVMAAIVAACGALLAAAIGFAGWAIISTHDHSTVATMTILSATPAPAPIAETARVSPPSVAAPPVTSTVTVVAPAPAPAGIPAPPPDNEAFAICPSGHTGIATAVTSCAFAENVRGAYAAEGADRILAYSPVTGETYVMACRGGFVAHLNNGRTVQAVRCAGGDNAVVVVW